MADNDSEYKFEVEDVGPEGVLDTDEESTDTDIGESLKSGFSITNVLLFPLSLLAVFTVFEKGAVVGALTSLFGGAAGVAGAVALGLQLAGLVVLAGVGLIAVATVFALLLGVVKRSVGVFALGIVGAIYLGVGSAGAMYVFTTVPFMVGFLATTFIVSWSIALLVGALGIVAMLFLM